MKAVVATVLILAGTCAYLVTHKEGQRSLYTDTKPIGRMPKGVNVFPRAEVSETPACANAEECESE